MSEYKYYKGISLTQQYDATVIGLINQNNRVIFMKSTPQIENEGQLLFIYVDTLKNIGGETTMMNGVNMLTQVRMN
ncbi:hypothetical protein [Clostridium botulinum]|uniref:Uncharacterized protein n=1 Tax=Clostridium botulinum TaxID=1491 RepID=A0A0M1M2L1_CLOBO|nr:hypothetical protein [Clostridium botulinum]KOR64126.1 hypothetical protein ADT22_01800 [Clostridium botulinum]MCS6112567.1 hypothetical protein [Clostridium botulinum]NFF88693.1 hypothetical protein [Clostridium botulinum]NFG11233.1 hypothetical protein [Clostridium botulinum]NFL43425.1 hypothetical protein [Clostridium botulinum]